MRNLFPGLIVGIIFGAGLALSDMVNPARVQAFLDVAGAWDPTLMFVMGAALVPSAIAYLARRRMTRPLLGERFSIPESRTLDRPLLLGAAMFGVGWGLVGFCPGPALAGLVLGAWQPWLFVMAMLAGMAIHHLYTAPRSAVLKHEG
ncbi:MAG TPA: YeeE/YedE family protein [Allosphingosinicella sp.]